MAKRRINDITHVCDVVLYGLYQSWIGDHHVDFIVDSGSSVNAISENVSDYS